MNQEFFAAVQAMVNSAWPGVAATEVVIKLSNGQKAKLPVPLKTAEQVAVPVPVTPKSPTLAFRPVVRASTTSEVFVPNAVQRAILDALDGKALRSTTLGELVGDRARIFRKPLGGMQELRDLGLVEWHTRLGFYRPDSPPDELPSIPEEEFAENSE